MRHFLKPAATLIFTGMLCLFFSGVTLAAEQVTTTVTASFSPSLWDKSLYSVWSRQGHDKPQIIGIEIYSEKGKFIDSATVTRGEKTLSLSSQITAAKNTKFQVQFFIHNDEGHVLWMKGYYKGNPAWIVNDGEPKQFRFEDYMY